MSLTPRKINVFNAFKLPAAFIAGVRVKTIDATSCKVTVRHRWINQNPFKSMFWAVQGMAAELTTGALVISKLNESGLNVSMLLTGNNSSFSKKATGKITFICKQGAEVDMILKKAIATNEGQTIWMNSVGMNSEGVEVSNFNFQWSIKVRA
jgi:Cu/Ag efflux protein CusF